MTTAGQPMPQPAGESASHSRSGRRSRGNTQARLLRPNEPVVFGWPQDRFTTRAGSTASSLRAESQRAESQIYGAYDPEASWMPTGLPFGGGLASVRAPGGSGAGDTRAEAIADLSMSAIERPASAPMLGGEFDEMALGDLPEVMSEVLSIEWDRNAIPKGKPRPSGLTAKGELSAQKLLGRYKGEQQWLEGSSIAGYAPPARPPKVQPVAMVQRPHPSCKHWPEERHARVDRLAMPVPTRLRVVAERRAAPKPKPLLQASAYHAHTTVKAALIYSSDLRGWQSRKTPYARRRARRKRESGSRGSSGLGLSSMPEMLSYPEEWEGRVGNLSTQFADSDYTRADVRFPCLNAGFALLTEPRRCAQIIQALLHTEGHAGKAERLLRGGIAGFDDDEPSPGAQPSVV